MLLENAHMNADTDNRHGKVWFIYALGSKEAPLYIGVTKSPASRFGVHRVMARKIGIDYETLAPRLLAYCKNAKRAREIEAELIARVKPAWCLPLGRP